MNKKIVIDAGHGGEDSGAVANGLKEKDLTLKIAKYIKRRLDELGIESTLTRDSDITLNPSDRVNKILNTYGNGEDVIVLSNHINAGGGSGSEVIYALRNNDELGKNILNELVRVGQTPRKVYQKRSSNNPSKDYYYILRETPNTEAIIIEYGFIDDKTMKDVNTLRSDIEKLAEATVKGLTAYLGVDYNTDVGYYYTVQRGDTLWSIARKFNLTVDKLKDINNLNSNVLSIGQKLIVSENMSSDNNYYIVKSGDTLYSIAKKFNISVDELKDINNLSNDLLSVGQSLKINKSNNEYVVEKGDTLYSIARKFNTSVSTLADLNNLSTSLLYVGQKLIIP
ncbi:MAG: LysM peptidoglycan-binding domain-containing protein [Firmicutes bacterium]|nr:LysM peptidoglycan-binding domain-containing protein [Bacillota bacterium]